MGVPNNPVVPASDSSILREARPVALDLCVGLGGWAEGLTSVGYYVIGVDIEDMFAALGEPKPDHFELVLADICNINGADYAHVSLIVGSSPCQDFSYRAMPWKRAKAMHAPFRGMWLFWQQFRIQREASEAKGEHIPMVVENVRGAQGWIGKAKWNAGSMYFWGDVPALMPPHKVVKVQSFRFDGSGRSFQTASVRRTEPGNGARFTSRDCGAERCGCPRVCDCENFDVGLISNECPVHNHFPPPQPAPDCPVHGDGGNRSRWFNDGPRSPGSISSSSSSPPARKAASARIAKIPAEISAWIGRAWLPERAAA